MLERANIPEPTLPPGASRAPVFNATRLRVRYCECDPMNVAHHAAYAPWLEIGRTELLRGAGMTYAAMAHAGVLLVIVKLGVTYRRPVRYDDVIEVRTRWVGGSRVKIEHEYEIVVVERDASLGGVPASPHDVAAVASTTLACVGRDGRPMALPEWLAGGGSSRTSE